MKIRSKLAFFRARRQRRAVSVFISYTERHVADRTVAEKIHNALTASGAISFLAPLSIEAGDTWRTTLRRNIEDCTHFVPIVSEASIHSEEVMKEIEQAVERQRAGGDLRFVPILYGKPSRNPFAPTQAILLADNDLAPVITRLMKTIGIAPRRSNRPAAGRLVPLLCNREEQEDAVDAILNGAAEEQTLPAAFFVCGVEDDNAESFIDRIVALKLVDDIASEPPRQVRIPWRGGMTQTAGPRALRTLVWNKFDWPMPLAPAEPCAALLAQHAGALPERVVVVTHTLHADEWSDTTGPLLADYLDFWDAASDANPRPLFILFFEIVYASGDGDTPAPSPAVIRAAIKAALAKPRRIRTNLLRDLGCVKEKHVSRWFDTYGREVPSHARSERIKQLFTQGDCQKMQKIEEHLRAVQYEFMENQ